MSRPSETPSWATDTNYTSGPDTGTPVRAAPSAGYAAQGQVPGAYFGSQAWNYVVGLLCDWIAALKSESSAALSIAALNWTAVDHGMTPGIADIVDMGGGAAIGVGGVAGAGTQKIVVSPDYGASWFLETHPSTADRFTCVHTDGAGVVIASGSSGGGMVIMVSADSGATWTDETLVGVATAATDSCYEPGAGNHVIWTGGAAGAQRVAYSTDNGATWSVVTPATGGINRIVSDTGFAGRIVAVGNSGAITTSDDGGVTWTARTSGTANDLNAVLFMDEIPEYIALGENGTVLASPDGTTWTARTTIPSADTVISAGYRAGLLIAIAGDSVGGGTSSGVVYFSVDRGVTWASGEGNFWRNAAGIAARCPDRIRNLGSSWVTFPKVSGAASDRFYRSLAHR
jgi:hypothetical protein